MLENPADPPAYSNSLPAPVKRFVPPNQRNRNPNRRKSGERFERPNSSHSVDGDKNFSAAFRSILITDHGDVGSCSLNENFHAGLISLNGCCRSDASQLLRERWEAAIRSYHDRSIDLSERPVMYTGTAQSAWGAFKLPHQLMPASQNDFLGELRRAIHNRDLNSRT